MQENVFNLKDNRQGRGPGREQAIAPLPPVQGARIGPFPASARGGAGGPQASVHQRAVRKPAAENSCPAAWTLGSGSQSEKVLGSRGLCSSCEEGRCPGEEQRSQDTRGERVRRTRTGVGNAAVWAGNHVGPGSAHSGRPQRAQQEASPKVREKGAGSQAGARTPGFLSRTVPHPPSWPSRGAPGASGEDTLATGRGWALLLGRGAAALAGRSPDGP